MAGLFGRAAGLAVANAVTRAMGFALKLYVSRLLGAEALGIHEMACGVHMTAITPLTAGLPSVVSRETAKRPLHDGLPLKAGRQLALRYGLMIVGVYLTLSPLLARLLGDARTLPTLLVGAPCVLLVGLSSVYNGHCHGVGRALPPAVSEILEQTLRLLIAPALLLALPVGALSLRAAAPMAATLIAEAVGLSLVVIWLRGASGKHERGELSAMRRKLTRAALPLTGARVTVTALRMLMGVMVPLRLVASGLPRGEAVAGYGMLGGMATPLTMLPCMLTGAMAVVGAPAFSRLRTRGKVRALMKKMLCVSAPLGALCATALYLCADFIAAELYAHPPLAPVLRFICPMALLMPLTQTFGAAMVGLGLQASSLRASLYGAFVTLALCYVLTASSQWRLLGAATSLMVGQCVSLCTQVCAFVRHARTI